MTPPVRYTTLSTAAIADLLAATAADATATFGAYDGAQLNWQPEPSRWSVAQCFDHLLKSDDLMQESITRALDPRAQASIWQRLPLWPRLLGPLLVRAVSPGATRKYPTSPNAQPASSGIAPDVIGRFAAHQKPWIEFVGALTQNDARRVVASPFLSQVTYSALDACRIVAAHQRRHFEQARRVSAHPEFPRAR